MTPEQVFGKLNKDIKGLTSGVASASVSGSSIIFTMNDGSTQTITFPQPKDGASIVAVSTNENNQFVFSMSDGTEIVGGEVPASSGVSKEYVDSELSKKANNSDIPTKVSGLQNDSNYQTDTDVATALTPYAKSADVTKEITNKVAEIIADAPEDFNTLKEMSDWITNHENDASAMNSAIQDNKSAITALQTDKADKTEIPTIPTNVSEFTNDAGYLTEHQDISNLVVKEEGKGLSSNDYTSEEKAKLGNIGTSQGRNIIPYPYSQATKTVYGVTFTDNKDGSIGISGTQDGSTSRPYMGIGIWWNETDKKTGNISISANTYFTISANCGSNTAGLRYYVYNESGSKLADNIVYGNDTKTLKFDVDTWVALCIETAANSGIYDCTCKPQLELGSIAHAYEPPIESNVNLKAEIDKISTSQGRNLIHYPYYNGTSYELNGITYTVNEADGTITVNGTATKESDFRLINPYEPYGRKTLELGQTYTLSDSVNQPNGIGYQAPVYFQFVRIDTTKNDFNYGISTNYGNMTWTASDANLLQYGIRIVVRSGVTADNVVMKPMLEIGAIAHSYEPTTESNVNLKEAVKGLVTPQGKNLISYPYTSKEGTGNGITWTVNDDGTITADGTATNNSFFNLTNYIVGTWDTLHAGTYTIMDGVNLPIGGVTLQIESTSGTQYKNKTFTIEQDVVYKIFIYIPKGTVADNITFKPMLEVGSIAHMYEPTTESNISLKSAIDGKADKSKVEDVNWTSVDISSVDENTNAEATINYCIKNGICYMSILNIGFKTANQAIILGANSIPKPSSDYCWSPLVGVTDPSYSVLIHPNVSGGLEHHSVGLTSQIYSGLFSYPVAES